MPDAMRDSGRLKKCARFPDTESAACACRRQRRCSAWRGEGTRAVGPRRAAIGQERRPPPVDPLQKKRKVSSRDGIHAGKRLAKYHESASRSGSNGSAASLPSAFLSRISTRPSASSSCFWHSRDRATPSSKSFMASRSEEHTSELQSRLHLVCRLLLEKKKKQNRSKLLQVYNKVSIIRPAVLTLDS